MNYFVLTVIGILNGIAWVCLYRWGYHSGYIDGMDYVIAEATKVYKKHEIARGIQEAINEQRADRRSAENT